MQVEKEALALTWAVERGIDATLETDHKPLVSMLGKMPIDLLTPRVQRFRMRMMRNQFQIVCGPGKSLITADVLSRVPMKADKLAGALTVSEAPSFDKSCVQGLQTGDNFVNRVCDAQKTAVVCHLKRPRRQNTIRIH